ncbi:MAG: hypothetical protein K8I03_09115 [Ignavibacteria bacterium]|nr:hypothetical protein [Ignavibacteria bacterium]
MSVKIVELHRGRNTKLEYITDIKGKKTKVVMPIGEYENLLEDLHDLSVIAQRKKENLLTLDSVLNGLKKDGSI